MADRATARADRAAQAGYLPEDARVLLLSVAAARNDAALAALLERVDLARLYTLATEENAVDPVWRRIGAFGVSMGGTTIWSFAMDPRLKAACAI